MEWYDYSQDHQQTPTIYTEYDHVLRIFQFSPLDQSKKKKKNHLHLANHFNKPNNQVEKNRAYLLRFE